MDKDIKDYTKKPLILNNHKDVNIEDIFDIVEVDSSLQFIFKDHPDKKVLWYSDTELRKLYEYNSLKLELLFSREGLPTRCKASYEKLCSDFNNYLMIKRSRVSIKKLRYTLLIFFKNISRIKYHNKYAITYRSHHKNWVNTERNLNRAYFLDLLMFLEKRQDVMICSGFKFGEESETRNITSMIILNPNFIDNCNQLKSVTIEEEFRPEEKDSIVIHDDGDYNITLSKEEKIMAGKLEEMVDSYNQKLKEVAVKVNGFDVPEIFFRRVFSRNLKWGGRFYERNPSLQTSSGKIRDTTLIDGEATVEKDYKCLHVAMAYEEKGIKLDKDPYTFDLEIELDEGVVQEWCRKHKIERSTYDPVRNFKKTILLVMMNANDIDSGISGARYHIAKDYSKKRGSNRKFVGIVNAPVKSAVEKAIEYHKEISEYFCSGVGIRFQNLDSQMIEYCISQFLQMDEVVFPIHDSLIVKESCSDVAVEVMKEAYRIVMGSSLNCIIK